MKIDREQWTRLSALLDAALDIDINERETWLEQLPRDASALKEPLRTLLAQRARIETGDFLKTPDFASALRLETARAQTPAVDLQAHSQVGAYRLLRELGRGGMGAVWLAERVDGKLKRQVALKFPFAGPNQRQLAERLARERDILASLEHPNIARLYDADVTALGQPFLVLEYVDGMPINDYCDHHRLTIRERLVLFLQVLNAVQYAHTHLVIHRDLKPSNILINNDRVAQLLDFGIAKLISEGEAKESALTQFGGRALTPDYASPEQISGGSITTACDVYSLAVVLYELLTGSRPYRSQRDSQVSLEAAIAAADVVAPSRALGDSEAAQKRALTATQLERALRGDLDTIILKALKKKPGERYLTAAAFADDIERYLDNKAVVAQPDSAWYRVRKFTSRNRLAVGASFIVVVALGVGLIVALSQLRVARAEQKRAEDVKEFVASIFRSADPFFTGKQNMSATDLLAFARQRIDRELKAQPETAVELLTIVGESQLNLEQIDAAQATLTEAIKLGTASLGADDLNVAEAQARLAFLYVNERDYVAAKVLLASAMPILRKNRVRAARVLPEALQVRAFMNADEGNVEAAIADSLESVAIASAALGARHSETIMSKRHLAQTYLSAGRFAEGLPVAEEAYRDARAAFQSGEHNGVLVETEDMYGRALAEVGRIEEGVEHLRSSIQAAEALFGPKNATVTAKLSFLARAQGNLGDIEGMLDSAQRALDATSNGLDRARSRVRLGYTLLLLRHGPKAVAELELAVAESTQFDSGPGSWLPLALAEYGSALVYSARYAEGEKILRDNLQALGDANGPYKVFTLNGVGMAERQTGRAQQSLQTYRQALALSSDRPGMTLVLRTEALKGIGLALLDLGQPSEAEVTLQEAGAAEKRAFQRVTPLRVDVMVGLGRAALDQGRVAEALPLLKEANSYWSGYAADSRWAGESAYWYGRALQAAGRTTDAQQRLLRAVAILKTSKTAADAALVVDARARLAHMRS